MALKDLPRIDLVVISHNHCDPLDLDTIKALEAQVGGPPVFAVPLGIDLWMRNLGVSHVERFDWRDVKTLLGLDIHFLPSQHWSSRSLGDRNETLWGSWFLKSGKNLICLISISSHPSHFFSLVILGTRQIFLKSENYLGQSTLR
jgi:N-acyl-phosphatidylethanolamine-hydrolysing phospholipase D